MPTCKNFFLLVLAALILALGGLALAQDQGSRASSEQASSEQAPPGRADAPGGPPRLTDEQRAALDAIRDEHLARLEPIMDQIRDNRLLYKALSNNQSASMDDVRTVVDTLGRLRKELREEFRNYRQSLGDNGFGAFARRGRGGFGGRGLAGEGCVCPGFDGGDGYDDDGGWRDGGRRDGGRHDGGWDDRGWHGKRGRHGRRGWQGGGGD
ncbi:MAG: hypothetical protein LBP95_13215 [Deltaproteobacteria bacterium]|jgi:hypothetical protein|nr:hypothetical protein [Deltaproteobacteria bacterium]